MTANRSSFQASEEVLEYIRTHDLEAALNTTLRLVETSLPPGSTCTVEPGIDPESDYTWLVVDLAINSPRNQVLDRLDQFVDQWIDSVTPAAQCLIHLTYSAKDRSMKPVDEVELLAVWLYGEAEEAGQLSVLRNLIESSSKSAQVWYGLPDSETDEPDDPDDMTSIIGKFAAKWDEVEQRRKRSAAQDDSGSAS